MGKRKPWWLSKAVAHDLELKVDKDSPLDVGSGMGTARGKVSKEESFSKILQFINKLCDSNKLNEKDLIRLADATTQELENNSRVMLQISQNSKDKVMLGEFPHVSENSLINSLKNSLFRFYPIQIKRVHLIHFFMIVYVKNTDFFQDNRNSFF